MLTLDAIILAFKHSTNGAAMQSSAHVCLEDATALYEAGKFAAAKVRALKSLGYSVGIFHADYQKVARSVEGDADLQRIADKAHGHVSVAS